MLAGTGIKPLYEGVKKGTEGSPHVCCPRLIAIEASPLRGQRAADRLLKDAAR